MPVKATDKVFSLRIDTEKYNILLEQAKKNKRSVNSEIILAIDKYLSESQDNKTRK